MDYQRPENRKGFTTGPSAQCGRATGKRHWSLIGVPAQANQLRAVEVIWVRRSLRPNVPTGGREQRDKAMLTECQARAIVPPRHVHEDVEGSYLDNATTT